MSTTQRWYCKASVQTALVAGVFMLIAAVIGRTGERPAAVATFEPESAGVHSEAPRRDVPANSDDLRRLLEAEVHGSRSSLFDVPAAVKKLDDSLRFVVSPDGVLVEPNSGVVVLIATLAKEHESVPLSVSLLAWLLERFSGEDKDVISCSILPSTTDAASVVCGKLEDTAIGLVIVGADRLLKEYGLGLRTLPSVTSDLSWLEVAGNASASPVYLRLKRVSRPLVSRVGVSGLLLHDMRYTIEGEFYAHDETFSRVEACDDIAAQAASNVMRIHGRLLEGDEVLEACDRLARMGALLSGIDQEFAGILDRIKWTAYVPDRIVPTPRQVEPVRRAAVVRDGEHKLYSVFGLDSAFFPADVDSGGGGSSGGSSAWPTSTGDPRIAAFARVVSAIGMQPQLGVGDTFPIDGTDWSAIVIAAPGW